MHKANLQFLFEEEFILLLLLVVSPQLNIYCVVSTGLIEVLKENCHQSYHCPSCSHGCAYLQSVAQQNK